MGSGGEGGGAINLQIGGLLRVDGTISADGADEQDAVAALAALVQSGFGEDV